MNRTAKLEALIAKLVGELNAYNAPDMLDGYLDMLATEYNKELTLLNVKDEYGKDVRLQPKYLFQTCYSAMKNIIYVMDLNDSVAFTISEADLHGDVPFMTPEAIRDQVLEQYRYELAGFGFIAED